MNSLNKIENITFFYPSRVVGGAEYLFIRLANKLSELGYKVFIVDYKDGFLRKNVIKDVTVIDYFEGEKVEFTFNTHLILPPLFLNKMKELFSVSNNKRINCFFWSIAPHNVVSGIRGFHRFSSLFKLNEYEKYFFCVRPVKSLKIKKILNELHDSNGIFFMDYPNYLKNQEIFRLKFDPKYIPIPIEEPIQDKSPKTYKNKKITLAWYGRLGGEKVEALMKVLKDINTLYKEGKVTDLIEFLVIGDGEHLSDVEKFASKNISFTIKFLGTLGNEEAKELIAEKVDLAFAMGTSALEIGQTMTPVVSLDFSLKPFPSDYKYCWIFERKGYSVGNQVRAKLPNKHTMENIINDLNEDYENLAYHSYKYVNKNHNLNKIISMLIEALAENNYSIKKLL
ncbi:hypothetical protein ACFQ4X_14375 [Fictibacillus halophilus]|uniref:hypothetical protein n=1 Tax=Fictibacillus halophilus TaxID=1610490 RepID=UPI00362CBE88